MTPQSPRARFLADKHAAEAHAKVMSSQLFEKASDAAMLQTQLNLPAYNSSDKDTAAANHHRMEGAMLFLNILLTLGDPIPIAGDPPRKELNYEATKVK